MNDSTLDSDYQAAIEFIFSRLNYERAPGLAKSLSDFKLARMEQLMAALENPQQQVPTVHIAGSKGKGSTSTMLAKILETAGYRVGLFTSPHVLDYEERFTINGARPSPRQLVEFVDRIRPIVADMDASSNRRGPTFFEISTAIGWLYFATEEVDIAMIEVGLGGRLDSTNVCSPLVSVITSISLDHTHLLGNTEAEIAAEKAGIIKSEIPVVSGVRATEPAAVIEQQAAENASTLYRIDHEFAAVSRIRDDGLPRMPPRFEFDYLTNSDFLKSSEKLQIALPGEHQVLNAALAVTVAQLLQRQHFNISAVAIREGLATVRCPLRIEVVADSPLTIIDAAHNPASMKALVATLQHISAQRRVAVVAFSRDKDVSTLLQILDSHFDEFILTAYANPRAVSIDELSVMATQLLTKPWKTAIDSQAAVTLAGIQCSPNDLLCITGSFFLAAEVQARF